MQKHTLLVLLLLCAAHQLFSQQPEKYAMARIGLAGKPVTELATLGIETDHGRWLPGLSLTTALSEQEIKQVQAAGFPVEILIPDMVAWHNAQNQQVTDRGGACTAPGSDYPTPANYTYGSMGGYQTLDEIMAVLDDMHAKFPDLISIRHKISDTIVTHEGRPIWYVRISDNPEQQEAEPEVLYTALHHAREPNGMSQMLYFMWYLLENYPSKPEIKYLLENEQLYFIPCVNPDGYEYNRILAPNGGGGWRKNRRANADGTSGVDLNRNYGLFWGFDNNGSSPNPGASTYRGPYAFSEPETRAVRDFALEHQFAMALNYHTFSNLLIYPWAYSDQTADSSFVRWARLYSRENKYRIGTPIETVGYRVNGDSNDWMYGEAGTYSLTPEVGLTGFWPLATQIDALNKENQWQNLALALSALKFGVAEDKSAANFSEYQLQIPIALTRYGLADGSFTLSLEPLTPNVNAISAPQVLSPAHFETATAVFNVDLAPTVQAGDPVTLLLRIDNGTAVFTDTLYKTYGGNPVVVVSDTLNTSANWTGTWGTTTARYYSSPSSMTDSPGSEYANFSTNETILSNAVSIPATAQHATLRFYAQWEIDPSDYVQVMAYLPDGSAVPLCGKYTINGTNNQPVYTDVKADWVEECIDLSSYAGLDISIGFRLVSDGNWQADGFYFDDLTVGYTDPFTLGTIEVPISDFRITPNPVFSSCQLTWDNSKLAGDGLLEIKDVTGKFILTSVINLAAGNYTLSTGNWPSGVYFCQIRQPNGVMPGKKLVVTK